MSGAKWCASFTCMSCGFTIVKTSKDDKRQMYCSGRCKVRAWTKRSLPLCALCESPTWSKQGRCSRCRIARELTCVVCAASFVAQGRATCSEACAYRLRVSNTVRRAIGRKCDECGCAFIAKQNRTRHCRLCAKRILRRKQRKRVRNRTGGNSAQRAKRKGVPRDWGLRAEEVFERDQWRCCLCGCKTPQRLRGSTADNAPELDHIVPIALGGGHVFDNVQTLCRACNGRKGATAVGQPGLGLATRQGKFIGGM